MELFEKMEPKLVLMVVGALVALMGLLTLVAPGAIAISANTHAVLKIIVGLFALVVGFMSKD